MHANAHTPGNGGPIRNAFTLVELLTVVFIIGLLVSVVVTGQRGRENQRLDGAALRLVDDLRYAQFWSVANTADPAALVIDTDTNTYSIARVSDTGTPIAEPLTGSPYTRFFADGNAQPFAGITITTYDFATPGVLPYTGLGYIDQDDDATVMFTRNGISTAVTIDAETGIASFK